MERKIKQMVRVQLMLIFVMLVVFGGCAENNLSKRTEVTSVPQNEYILEKGIKLPEYGKLNEKEFYEKMVIVYSASDRGAAVAAKEILADVMKKRNIKGNIIKDTEVKKSDLTESNLIIIGNISNNKVISAMASELPAVADGEKVTVKIDGKEDLIFSGKEFGATYYYPNLYNIKNSMIIMTGNSENGYKYNDFEKSDMMIFSGKIVSPLYCIERAFVSFGKDWKVNKVEKVDSKLLDTGENDALTVGEIKKYDFPEWARGKVIYEIFVRSFYDSNGDGTGDLNGMVSKLDYLQSMGVDIIWMMPIFESPSYHCYDTKDYFKINKDYGTNEDFIAAAKEIHKRGMKIILDVPFNQASKLEPHFMDAHGNPDSKYDRWFYFCNIKNTIYNDYAFKSVETGREVTDGTMPAWNTNNPEVVDFHASITKFWMDPNGDGDYADGADGFRLDYARGPTHEYWKALRQKTKEIRSDVLLIGEAWLPLDEVAKYFENEFDAAYDFNLQGSLTTGVKKDIDSALETEAKFIPENGYFARFLSNHDMDRFPTFKKVDELKIDAALIFTLKGMPTIYYGDEIGMKGDKGDGDEGVRRPMEWYADNKGAGMTTWEGVYDKNRDGVSVEEQVGKEESLLEYYKKLSAVRKANLDIIENAKREDVPVFEIKDGKEVVARKIEAYVYNKEGKALLVVLNFGKGGDYVLDFTKTTKLDGVVKDYKENSKRVNLKNEKISVSLDGNRAYIMEE